MRRHAHLQQAESDSNALPFDTSAARALGRVAASLRPSVRKPVARSSHAMIAATALAHGLPVYTCNPDDFSGIDGIDVVAVPVSVDMAARDDAARVMSAAALRSRGPTNQRHEILQ